MQNQDNGIGVQVAEVNRVENMNGTMLNYMDIDRLAAANTMLVQPIRPPLVTQQAVNYAPVIRRSIPDQVYTPGRIWLGECPVCRNHDNEGFLRAYENTTPTCAHPLCQECADRILTTTRTCPKCRRLVDSFLRVRIP